MCKASRPRMPPPAPPPPMAVPEVVDEDAQRARRRQRARVAGTEGRNSTILTPYGAAPTAQAKTLIGA